MASVTIKGREETLEITVGHGIDFTDIMKELQEKLSTMQRLSQSRTWEAFFSIPDYLNDVQLYQIFQSVAVHQGTITGFINQIAKPEISYYEHDVHSGEALVFQNTTLIFGNVHPDSFVTCDGDLLVMGQIEGNIYLSKQSSILYATAMLRANLQISDEIRHEVTSFAPCKFYYGSAWEKG